jgi:hypothetical protein
MSTIDNITVILGPPAEAADKVQLERDAAAAGASVDDTYIGRVAAFVGELSATANGAPSDLDRYFSELMDREVRVTQPVPTWFEKKGNRYPAIMIAARDVVDADGASVADAVTAAFLKPATPAALAQRIGVRLGLESAKTFYTFDANG